MFMIYEVGFNNVIFDTIIMNSQISPLLQPSTVAPSIHGGTRGASASVTNLMDTNAAPASSATETGVTVPPTTPMTTTTAPMTPVSASFPISEALRTSTPVSARPENADAVVAEDTPMEPAEQR